MMTCTSDLKFLGKKKNSAAKWINEQWLKIQEKRIIPFYIP